MMLAGQVLNATFGCIKNVNKRFIIKPLTKIIENITKFIYTYIQNYITKEQTFMNIYVEVNIRFYAHGLAIFTSA